MAKIVFQKLGNSSNAGGFAYWSPGFNTGTINKHYAGSSLRLPQVVVLLQKRTPTSTHSGTPRQEFKDSIDTNLF